MTGVDRNPDGRGRRTLRSRIRASARRARDGGDGGIAGRALARIGYGDDRPPAVTPRTTRSSSPRVLRTTARDERVDQPDEEPVDGFDDEQLAALREELDGELERLARPRNDEAPDA